LGGHRQQPAHSVRRRPGRVPLEGLSPCVPPEGDAARGGGIRAALPAARPTSGFQRICHYGWLANRNRAVELERCRQLLDVPAPAPVPADESADYRDRYQRLTGVSLWACRRGRMIGIETWQPGTAAWATRRRVMTIPPQSIHALRDVLDGVPRLLVHNRARHQRAVPRRSAAQTGARTRSTRLRHPCRGTLGPVRGLGADRHPGITSRNATDSIPIAPHRPGAVQATGSFAYRPRDARMAPAGRSAPRAAAAATAGKRLSS